MRRPRRLAFDNFGTFDTFASFDTFNTFAWLVGLPARLAGQGTRGPQW